MNAINIEAKTAEIMAKAKADIIKAETECEIIKSLPLVPSSVHVYPLYGCIASARYNATSKAHALEIFETFRDILPSYVCRDNNTVSVRAVDDGKSAEVSECLAIAEIEKYDQQVRFYVQTKAGIVKVHISMGFCPFGQFVVADGHRTKYWKWTFRPANKLGALFRVASYAQVSSTGDMSGPHYLYAAYERFEIVDQLSDEVQS